MEGTAYNIVITIGLDEIKLEANQTGGWGTDTDANAVPTESTVNKQADAINNIIEAFDAGVSEYTLTYTGEDGALDIDLSTASTNLDMDIVINLPDQQSAVEITIPENYTGSIIIYAPQATVTAETTNGTEYTDVTVTTAQSTFIIPAGVVVNGLTILGGNVEVYGELSGDVVKGENNNESTTIEFKYGSTNSTTSIDTDITVIDNITSNGFTIGTQNSMLDGGNVNINQ